VRPVLFALPSARGAARRHASATARPSAAPFPLHPTRVCARVYAKTLSVSVFPSSFTRAHAYVHGRGMVTMALSVVALPRPATPAPALPAARASAQSAAAPAVRTPTHTTHTHTLLIGSCNVQLPSMLIHPLYCISHSHTHTHTLSLRVRVRGTDLDNVTLEVPQVGDGHQLVRVHAAPWCPC
jgi:hypothetical protein